MNAEPPASYGSEPIRSEPFQPWPFFERAEIDATVKVLESGRVNYWTGDHGRLFEEEFASYTGCRYAVALANGTVALEAALLAFGIGSGDEVIVPSRTFVATASSVVLQGARPIMADVDPVSQNITAETVRNLITPRTRAIIAVHLAGWPCDMDPLIELARGKGIRLIEDCAQAHGATYKGRPAGSLGDIAAFSFCQDKIMTTGGEGGMLTTDDQDIRERVWSYKDHGKSYDAVYNHDHPVGFRWLHESFGTNWRLTEVQSAIGRLQLAKLDSWLESRRHNAAMLTEGFSTISAIRLTVPPPEVEHSYYKYYCFIKPEMLREGWDRDRIMRAVSDEGIPCFSGTCGEIYLERAFVDGGLTPSERLPQARKLGETSLMFQVHPTLGTREMQETCAAVEKVFNRAAI
ncbi:MAG: DegT/DnrJ/EryC1/StrS aminotransferase family protein [Thermoleophilia bacterium]|nr:DegT/DnrJ/EryC1/StrS aminotransferase family protein [Thermoleophilia bacterium]